MTRRGCLAADVGDDGKRAGKAADARGGGAGRDDGRILRIGQEVYHGRGGYQPALNE